MKLKSLLLCIALAACATAPSPDAPQTITVYERWETLRNDGDVRARMQIPSQRIHDFDWMLGDWNMTVTTYGGEDSSEPSEPERVTFRRQGDSLIVDGQLSMILGYDSFEERWFSAAFEPPAVPMAQSYSAADWDGSQLVFDADVQIFGERYVLRQTLVKLSDTAFELRNAQQVAPGEYRNVDLYHYERERAE